ncbi:MAG: sugar porter family MFS transporter [Negativicutes bacterium]|jgi:sugar porter (SP) family MFS transporter
MTGTQKRFLWMIIFTSAIAGVLYGYDLGIISAAFLVLPKHIPMNETMMGFLGSAVLFGGAFTILIAGPLADFIGRKKMIVAANIIFLVGVALLGFAQTYIEIIAGRLVQGVGVGIITIVVPLYLAEVLPSNYRGRGILAFQLLLACGIFFANLVGLHFTASENWRGMFLSSGLPCLLLLLLCFGLPESPRWLVAKGKKVRALNILRRINPPALAQSEVLDIESNLEMTKGESNWRALFDKRYTWALFLVFSNAILIQLTGINSILQYSGIILKEAGLGSNEAAMLGSTILTSVIIVIPLLVMFIIDSFGRKKILCIGTAGVFVTLAAAATVFLTMAPSTNRGIAMIVCLTAFLISYSFGPSGVIWLMLSELLPNKIRSVGMSAALFANSMVSSIFAIVFLQLSTYIAYSGVFYMCSIFGLLYFYIAYKYVPETKGKSLEQIERELVGGLK